MGESLLFSIGCCLPLELLLIFRRRVRAIFDLWVFAGKSSGAAVRLEVFRGGLVTPDLHNPKLVPLPLCQRLSEEHHVTEAGSWGHTVKVGRTHKRYMYAKITVVGGTIEAEIDAERHGGPCRVLPTAVKTYLYSIRV